jgi:hypothetical protein
MSQKVKTVFTVVFFLYELIACFLCFLCCFFIVMQKQVFANILIPQKVTQKTDT